MPQRPGHERRTDMYARAKSRPKSFNALPISMQVASHAKALNATPGEKKQIGKVIRSGRRFGGEQTLSPKQAEAYTQSKPSKDPRGNAVVMQKTYSDGEHGIVKYNLIGGSATSGTYGNRKPSDSANDLLNGKQRSDMSVWKK